MSQRLDPQQHYSKMHRLDTSYRTGRMLFAHFYSRIPFRVARYANLGCGPLRYPLVMLPTNIHLDIFQINSYAYADHPQVSPTLARMAHLQYYLPHLGLPFLIGKGKSQPQRFLLRPPSQPTTPLCGRTRYGHRL